MSAAPSLEEVLQQPGAFVGEHTALDLCLVVELRLVKHVDHPAEVIVRRADGIFRQLAKQHTIPQDRG